MSKILNFIEDRLKHGKNWRKVNKTMNLIEYLIKNGNHAIISSFKQISFDISKF